MAAEKQLAYNEREESPEKHSGLKQKIIHLEQKGFVEFPYGEGGGVFLQFRLTDDFANFLREEPAWTPIMERHHTWLG